MHEQPEPLSPPATSSAKPAAPAAPAATPKAKPVEIGGPKGLEPTRYGDWESQGRCIDF
ncbi:MAG: DUF1674 domain-containing protein [Gammaproteobacteria bacterium]|nr:DUF1674 domain-containing protein [Gammaproteobacteria bacterium]